MKSETESMCYVGRNVCGCVSFLSFDIPALANENAEAIAEIIRDGGTVDRVPLAQAKAASKEFGGCTHKNNSTASD